MELCAVAMEELAIQKAKVVGKLEWCKNEIERLEAAGVSED